MITIHPSIFATAKWSHKLQALHIYTSNCLSDVCNVCLAHLQISALAVQGSWKPCWKSSYQNPFYSEHTHKGWPHSKCCQHKPPSETKELMVAGIVCCEQWPLKKKEYKLNKQPNTANSSLFYQFFILSSSKWAFSKYLQIEILFPIFLNNTMFQVIY